LLIFPNYLSLFEKYSLALVFILSASSVPSVVKNAIALHLAKYNLTTEGTEDAEERTHYG
jgi:hypothetical protein